MIAQALGTVLALTAGGAAAQTLNCELRPLDGFEAPQMDEFAAAATDGATVVLSDGATVWFYDVSDPSTPVSTIALEGATGPARVSVDVDGSYAFVGRPDAVNPDSADGRIGVVHVCYRSNGVWRHRENLWSPSSAQNFGTEVRIANTVGAVLSGNSRLVAYTRSHAYWNAGPNLKLADNGDYCLTDGRLSISYPDVPQSGGGREGTVAIRDRSGTGWSAPYAVRAPGQFGESITMHGNELLVASGVSPRKYQYLRDDNGIWTLAESVFAGSPLGGPRSFVYDGRTLVTRRFFGSAAEVAQVLTKSPVGWLVTTSFTTSALLDRATLFSSVSLEGGVLAVAGQQGGAWVGRVECAPCPADLSLNLVHDQADVTAFINLYTSGEPAADVNEDGAIDFWDLTTFLRWFARPCAVP